MFTEKSSIAHCHAGPLGQLPYIAAMFKALHVTPCAQAQLSIVGLILTPVAAVVTENSVRFENAEVPIIREIMVATSMIFIFVITENPVCTRCAAEENSGLVTQSHNLGLMAASA